MLELKGINFEAVRKGDEQAVIGMLNNRDVQTAFIGDIVLNYHDDIKDQPHDAHIYRIDVYRLEDEPTKLAEWYIDETERALLIDTLRNYCHTCPDGSGAGTIGWRSQGSTLYPSGSPGSEAVLINFLKEALLIWKTSEED